MWLKEEKGKVRTVRNHIEPLFIRDLDTSVYIRSILTSCPVTERESECAESGLWPLLSAERSHRYFRKFVKVRVPPVVTSTPD